MSDEDDRFAALGEVDQDDEPEIEDSAPEPELEPERNEEPKPVTESQPKTTEKPEVNDSIEDPAFSYAESNQGPIYARAETWDKYDDTLELDVERYLRDEGIRNAQKRELHDAALRLAAECPEKLADLLIEARRDQ